MGVGREGTIGVWAGTVVAPPGGLVAGTIVVGRWPALAGDGAEWATTPIVTPIPAQRSSSDSATRRRPAADNFLRGG